MNTLKKLVLTQPRLSAFCLRIALGIVILPHGLQKAFGWFGGGGVAGTLTYFTEKVGVPTPLAVVVILTETLGAVALLSGCFTRIAAFAIGFEMLVAALLVHLPRGFFMNWYNKPQGEGYEFHILAVGIAIALVALGGGRFSVDRVIAGASEDKPNDA